MKLWQLGLILAILALGGWAASFNYDECRAHGFSVRYCLSVALN